MGGSGGIKPKLKPDYAMGSDGTAAPIPGTPEAEKVRAALVAKQQQLRKTADVANMTNGLLGKVRGFGAVLNGQAPTAGLVGGLLSHVPGTDAYDMARQLDTVRANVGFDQLATMRAASPTGGALGNVSDNEGRLLQAVNGNTSQWQDPDQLRANLAHIRGEYRTRAAEMGARTAQPGSPVASPRPMAARPQGPVKIMGDADYARLPSGAEFIAPDGSHRRKP